MIRNSKPRVAVHTNCLNCNSQFLVTPKRLALGRGKYCSKECKATHQTFTFNCAKCGKECTNFISRKREKNYCSPECSFQSNFIDTVRKGSNHYNYQGALHSNTYRREAFAIHGKHCMKCGTSENTQVHHVDHNHRNNQPDGSNWEILCTKCHWEYHGKIKAMLAKQRIINCPYCNKEFVALNKNIKHCSKSCALKNRYKRKRETSLIAT